MADQGTQARERTQTRQTGRGFMGGPGPHMMPTEKKTAKDVAGTMRRIWDFLKKHRLRLVSVAMLVAVTTGVNVLGPYLMGHAIDRYIMPGDISGLARIALMLAAVYLVTSLTTWLQTFVMVGATQRTVRDMRFNLFAHLQKLSLRFFDRHRHGELMSRVSNDIENVSNVLTESVTSLLSSVLTVAGVGTMMFILNVRLAAVSLITIPLMIWLTKWISTRTRKGFREQQKQLGELNGIIEETVTGARVVKAYVRESAAVAEFENTNQRLRSAAVKAQTYALVLPPINNFVNNLGFAIIAGFGGWMALEGLATVGTIAAFISYARQFGRPLSQIANLYNTIQSAMAGAERVFAITDEKPEILDAEDAVCSSKAKGEVVFSDVSFRYEPEKPVLNRVSFHAEPGQTVALVGPTGAGKTTIVNLLTRFYEIDEGSIRIDGLDIRQWGIDNLRSQLGIVLQDTFLFSAAVSENIRYGRIDATDEEVLEASIMANAHQFIHRLPKGYDTLLSEEGSNLSQGQRQLIAIARAILANPRILILDEATSSVDTRTEIQIQEGMLRLMAGRTSFVIAHRLSTIRKADKILVINNGEIVEKGRHSELLSAKGFYHSLYMSQFAQPILNKR